MMADHPRAGIRKHGVTDKDFNKEIMEPFKREIEIKWTLVFKYGETEDIFQRLHTSIELDIRAVLDEIEQSVSPSLSDKDQGFIEAKIEDLKAMCCHDMRRELRKVEADARVLLTERQQDAVKMTAKHWLVEGYNNAMKITGKGCMQRQKVWITISIMSM